MCDSKDLVTHGVCVGMTGSGKTGLCIGLLEEAAIDSIPALVIDPKGDMANLLLTFPNLSAGEFLPWVNADEAARSGQPFQQYASDQAELWKKGLKQWGQDEMLYLETQGIWQTSPSIPPEALPVLQFQCLTASHVPMRLSKEYGNQPPI